MGNTQGPTPADMTKLTAAVKDLSRAMNSMSDGLRAANTNLVALHEQLKEKETDG